MTKKVKKAVQKAKTEKRLKATFLSGPNMVPEAVIQWNAWRFYSTPAATAIESFSQQVFNLTSVYDPHVYQSSAATIGNTVQNWVQMASLYLNYIVKKCRFKLYFFPQSASTTNAPRQARIWWWIDNDPALPTAANIPGIPGVKTKWVPVIFGGVDFAIPCISFIYHS